MDEDEKYQFLSDEAPAEPEVEAQEAETVEQPVAAVPEPEIPAPEATTAPEREQEMVPYAALKAERRKRQEYEAQLQQFQKQFDPSVFHQDPRAIQEYVDTSMAHIRVELSREMAMAQFPDYAELEELFVEEAQKNPALVGEMLQHGSPALYAYNTAKALKTVRDAKTGELEKRLRAEIEAKVRAEFKAQPAAVPPDLSNARSAAAQQPVEDMSLESILQSRKR